MSKELYKFADEEDLQGEKTRIIKEIAGTEISIFKRSGDYHAVANFCPHQSGPLCEGQVVSEISRSSDGWQFEESDEEAIVCPWHGWRFDIETGESLQTDRYAVPTYEVEVEDGEIYIRR